jgi:hypothetical protein
MSVLSRPVVLLPSLPVGINVNHDSAEVRQVVEELVADPLRDLVTISHRQPPGDRDAHLRVEAIHKEGDVRVLFIDLIHFAVSWMRPHGALWHRLLRRSCALSRGRLTALGWGSPRRSRDSSARETTQCGSVTARGTRSAGAANRFLG